MIIQQQTERSINNLLKIESKIQKESNTRNFFSSKKHKRNYSFKTFDEVHRIFITQIEQQPLRNDINKLIEKITPLAFSDTLNTLAKTIKIFLDINLVKLPNKHPHYAIMTSQIKYTLRNISWYAKHPDCCDHEKALTIQTDLTNHLTNIGNFKQASYRLIKPHQEAFQEVLFVLKTIDALFRLVIEKNDLRTSFLAFLGNNIQMIVPPAEAPPFSFTAHIKTIELLFAAAIYQISQDQLEGFCVLQEGDLNLSQCRQDKIALEEYSRRLVDLSKIFALQRPHLDSNAYSPLSTLENLNLEYAQVVSDLYHAMEEEEAKGSNNGLLEDKILFRYLGIHINFSTLRWMLLSLNDYLHVKKMPENYFKEQIARMINSHSILFGAFEWLNQVDARSTADLFGREEEDTQKITNAIEDLKRHGLEFQNLHQNLHFNCINRLVDIYNAADLNPCQLAIALAITDNFCRLITEYLLTLKHSLLCLFDPENGEEQKFVLFFSALFLEQQLELLVLHMSFSEVEEIAPPNGRSVSVPKKGKGAKKKKGKKSAKKQRQSQQRQLQNTAPAIQAGNQEEVLENERKEEIVEEAPPPPKQEEANPTASFLEDSKSLFAYAQTLMPAEMKNSLEEPRKSLPPLVSKTVPRSQKKNKPPISNKDLKNKNIIKLLNKMGFYPVRQTGSHLMMSPIGGKGVVPVPMHSTMALGTYKSVLDMAQEIKRHSKTIKPSSGHSKKSRVNPDRKNIPK